MRLFYAHISLKGIPYTVFNEPLLYKSTCIYIFSSYFFSYALPRSVFSFSPNDGIIHLAGLIISSFWRTFFSILSRSFICYMPCSFGSEPPSSPFRKKSDFNLTFKTNQSWRTLNSFCIFILVRCCFFYCLSFLFAHRMVSYSATCVVAVVSGGGQ